MAKRMLTARKNVTTSTNNTGVEYVVNVARECKLNIFGNYNDANLSNCHYSFAKKKVLEAIQFGNEK